MEANFHHDDRRPRNSSMVSLVDHSDHAPKRGVTRQMSMNMSSSQDHQKHDRNSTDHTISSQQDTTAKRRMLGVKLTRTTLLRIFFLMSLVATALVCGFVTQRVIYDLEKEVGWNAFESVASSAVERAQEIAIRKVDSAIAMASVVQYAFPNASHWPFVALPGFSQTAQLLSKMSSTTSQGLIMVVEPELASDFEDFAYQTYRQQEYGDQAGTSDFGFGISKNEPRATTDDDEVEGSAVVTTAYPDGRLHDTNGTTNFGSKYNLLFPIFQHTNVNTRSLMFNVHSEKLRGVAIDSMLDCSAQKNSVVQEGDNVNADGMVSGCTVITDFIELLARPGPAALIYTPVYALQNNSTSTMVGMIGTTISWQDVLHNVVPDYIGGLDCVISTPSSSHTFRLHEGEAQLVGEGDFHDDRYSHLGHSVALADFQTNAAASAKYTLTIYPRDQLLTGFVSNSSVVFSLGFVSVIFFCGCLFFLYDFFMKHESHQRKKVLGIKRRFVRFISHEIRTPLNTVALGLELLHSEVGEFLQTLREKNEKENSDASVLVGAGTSSDINKPAVMERRHSTRSIGKSREDVEAWVDLLSDIQQNTDISISILNDLLNYDKIEDGSLKLEIDVVPIWHVVTKTVKEFDIQARKRQIHLESAKLQVQDMATTDDMISRDVKPVALDPECPDHFFQTKVIGDETRLCQVIRNLISNSLKFTPAGGHIQVKAVYKPHGLPHAVTPQLPKNFMSNQDVTGSSEPSACTEDHLGDTQLESSAPPRSGSICISVKDSGAGMTKEQLSQLFSEGVQFDANKLQAGGGSGLGLYITKGLVEQHGGFIVVTSNGKGHGSEFTVELPLYQFQELSEASTTFETVQSQVVSRDNNHHDEKDIATTASMDTPQESPAPPLGPAPKHRILVVDDALTNRKMLSRLLERNGHECIQAKDGKEAVDIYLDEIEQLKSMNADKGDDEDDEEYQPYSTILLDYEMPEMNGPECCEVLRSHGCRAIIFGVTGNLLEEDVRYFEEMGADCVLPKPVSIKQLESAWIDYGSGTKI